MRLILVRHPKPLVAPGLCYGRTDLAVAPDELARARDALAATLAPGLPLFSSPLRRCAELAAQLPCASLSVDARLAEIDFGNWEMRSWDDIPRAEVDAWAADVAHYRPGGGESVLQMAARVAAFHDELAQRQTAAALVVCHAGTMRLLAARHAGLPLRAMAQQAAGAPHQIAYGQCLILDS
ncbi:histidine phosphatase family protein [Janthinobacterium fluminis]|uniref:Histidine phosphatase family protein n=1 Tax=Janthinobacterium fluminis TaxID=2987524 RepID=A0ABT5K613_9BURK|nr:histidine phosphatase family protein [Janthinobacterium fluminis]MDC8759865.1 histidine phosphatase family protein [Janthinobacterium fluminis]